MVSEYKQRTHNTSNTYNFMHNISQNIYIIYLRLNKKGEENAKG
jgi:hypothetical protein